MRAATITGPTQHLAPYPPSAAQSLDLALPCLAALPLPTFPLACLPHMYVLPAYALPVIRMC